MLALKFVHSHLNMLGWVSMMIYGVGYHILPRFMGRPLYSNKIGEAQFYLANISLVGMLLFYSLNVYNPSGMYSKLDDGLRRRAGCHDLPVLLQYADDAFDQAGTAALKSESSWFIPGSDSGHEP